MLLGQEYNCIWLHNKDIILNVLVVNILRCKWVRDSVMLMNDSMSKFPVVDIIPIRRSLSRYEYENR